MARHRDQAARRSALIEATYAAGLEHGLRSLSLSDVAKKAGLTRGAVLYYYDDLDSLLVEAHAAGVTRFCDERDALVAEESDPRARLGIAIRSGLPSGPDDALMRLLLELDVLAGNSELHEELMREFNRRQFATYLGIVTAGKDEGVFSPTLAAELVARTFVALEDGYGIHIVADRVTTHGEARRAMVAVAAQLGCPTT